MSSLSTDEVLHLARLANLKLSKKEVETLKAQLSDVLGYFEQLKALRTDGVGPTSQTTGLKDVLRNDEVDVSRILPGEDALSGTDKTHNKAFVVAQLIDKNQ